jgi:hypothetical protein
LIFEPSDYLEYGASPPPATIEKWRVFDVVQIARDLQILISDARQQLHEEA